MPDPPVLPVLEVHEPARGAFHSGELVVSGRTQAGTGALSSLTVGEHSLQLERDGSFSHTLDPEPGLVFVASRLTDDLGERAVDARTVQVGEVLAPGQPIARAAYLQLGRGVLDDDDPDPDDFAGIVQRVIDDPSFSNAFVGQTFGESTQVTLTSLHHDGAQADIEPVDGLLYFDLRIANLDMGFETTLFGVDIQGSTHSDDARIYVDLALEPGPDGVVAQATSIDVDLRGFSWQTDSLPSGVEAAFATTIRKIQEDSLRDALDAQIPELLALLLDGFSFQIAVGSRASVDIALTVSEIVASSDGLLLGLDAGVSAGNLGSLPPGAGSLHTPAPGPAMPLISSRPLVLAIDDDFLNQLLFAVWHAGALSQLELSGLELIVLTGENLAPPLGPVANITVNLDLPPILSPSRDIGGDQRFSADLAIGELRLDIEREDGEHVRTSLGVAAGVELAIVNAGITLDLDNRPNAMRVQAGMLEYPAALDPGDLSSLFRLSAPGLVGGALDFLPALPTPSIDLGAASDIASLQGVVLTVSEAEVQVHDSGWLVIEGTLR